MIQKSIFALLFIQMCFSQSWAAQDSQSKFAAAKKQYPKGIFLTSRAIDEFARQLAKKDRVEQIVANEKLNQRHLNDYLQFLDRARVRLLDRGKGPAFLYLNLDEGAAYSKEIDDGVGTIKQLGWSPDTVTAAAIISDLLFGSAQLVEAARKQINTSKPVEHLHFEYKTLSSAPNVLDRDLRLFEKEYAAALTTRDAEVSLLATSNPQIFQDIQSTKKRISTQSITELYDDFYLDTQGGKSITVWAAPYPDTSKNSLLVDLYKPKQENFTVFPFVGSDRNYGTITLSSQLGCSNIDLAKNAVTQQSQDVKWVYVPVKAEDYLAGKKKYSFTPTPF